MIRGLSAMRHGEEETAVECSLDSLPDDVLFVLLSFCDLQTVARLSRVCRRLARIVSQECVWIWLSQNMSLVRDTRWSEQLPMKEQCRIANNWKHGHCKETRLIHHKVKQLPWLQLCEDKLWISTSNRIHCYRQLPRGQLREVRGSRIQAHQGDVCRFVVRDQQLVSGSRDGSLGCFSCTTGAVQWYQDASHTSDIQAVDVHNNIIVSGSRDATLKIWSMEHTEGLQQTILAQDRVWSLAINPDGCTFASGTAGLNHTPPLRLWNLNTAELVGELGSSYRNGAGVLDIQYESPAIMLTCGYDTFIRMWDLRASFTQCVKKWEEPFDSTIYCIKSDGENAIISGTARHGMTRLWDKRMTAPLQLYYTGRTSSPVYSLAFDMAHIYIALDKGINMLDFSIR